MKRATHQLKCVIYSVYFYTIFLALLYLFFLYGHIRFGDSKRAQNIEAWRKLSLHLIDTLFFLVRVRIKVTGCEKIPECPVVFAANHQSYLDPLVILHIVRRPFAAITAPFDEFPPIIRRWFAHMGCISVSRDVFEELRYEETIHAEQAIAACVTTLKSGTSLLIFPEGRREFKKRLLPFHLGVAKIALEACAPVVPITLAHVDTFFPTHHVTIHPVHLEATIMPPVALWDVSSNVLEDVVYLERRIKKHLPKSYFSEQSIPHIPHGKRAAFFDLDDTLTRSNIYQKLVVRYLMAHVSAGNFQKIPRLLVKRMLLKHGYFYLAAIRMLKGIRATEFLSGFYGYLKKHKKELFYPQMLELVRSHQEKGNAVFIISEEPQEILDPISKLLGVPCFGTILEKEKGVFTGEVVGHLMKDEYKREKMIELAKKHNLDLSKSYAYGDSYHDYAMLRGVGHAALVNPKKSFGARCKNLGMRIIHEK
ncbi:HAD-IB family hydrolase [Candidatus Uhrbacteria bacterium]|nr:HAD-IB family hydrolase [Candidatus Uhrbacteria bacterium]